MIEGAVNSDGGAGNPFNGDSLKIFSIYLEISVANQPVNPRLFRNIFYLFAKFGGEPMNQLSK